MTKKNSMADAPTVDLVRQTQAGDGAAQEELFQRYGPRVLSIVRMRLGRKLRQRVESMDIVQDVLGEALGRLGSFEMRDETSLLKWMARIAEHRICAQAHYHAALRRDLDRELSLDAEGRNSGKVFDLPDPLPSPSVEIIHAEESRTVQDAIAQLPERYREAILLREYIGADWETVAKALKVTSAGAARMLFSRGLSKLAEILDHKGIR